MASFKLDLQQSQREVLRVLRTSTRAMYFVTHPDVLQLDDTGARALGKAWNKLDELAQGLGVEPLSAFIVLTGEEDSAGVPAHQLLPTLTALTDMRDALLQLSEQGGCAYFEVDI